MNLRALLPLFLSASAVAAEGQAAPKPVDPVLPEPTSHTAIDNSAKPGFKERMSEIFDKIGTATDTVMDKVETAQEKIPGNFKVNLFNGSVKQSKSLASHKITPTAQEIMKADQTKSIEAVRLHSGVVEVQQYFNQSFGLARGEQRGFQQNAGIQASASATMNWGRAGYTFAKASTHMGAAGFNVNGNYRMIQDIGFRTDSNTHIKGKSVGIGHFKDKRVLEIGDKDIEINAGVGVSNLGHDEQVRARYDLATALGGTVTAYINAGYSNTSNTVNHFNYHNQGVHIGAKVDVPQLVEQAPALATTVGKGVKAIFKGRH